MNNKEYDIVLSALSIMKSRGDENQVKVHFCCSDGMPIDVIAGTITGFTNKFIHLRQLDTKNVKLPVAKILKIVDVTSYKSLYETTLTVNIDQELVGQAQTILNKVADSITDYESILRKTLLGEYVELVLKDKNEYSKLSSYNNNRVTNAIVRNKKFIGTILGLTIDDITPNRNRQSMSDKDVNFALVVEVNANDEINIVIANTAEFDVYRAGVCHMSQD